MAVYPAAQQLLIAVHPTSLPATTDIDGGTQVPMVVWAAQLRLAALALTPSPPIGPGCWLPGTLT
ncbi:hypothetical protein [Streptomyces aureus]|uniref:Uncharacterized protein n=1 Tax=Streptomyces aureus TaxID=193461 RepID=A0ABV4SYL2_9ACTN